MAEKKEQRRGLGRGLSALMADIETPAETSSPDSKRKATLSLPIEQLEPNPDQPRRQFDAEALDDLANSIRSKGIIQPLIVRAKASGQYEIVAQAAGIHEVPVVLREFSDEDVLEIAIIENIQRADLNAIEEAAGYEQLMSRFGHTQEKLAEALGKSRSHIANLLRLLNLPETVQEFVKDGSLSAGHARALITSSNPLELARNVIKKGLSVRETEKLAKAASGATTTSKSRRNGSKEKDPDTVALEGDLSAALGMKVAIQHEAGGDAGTVTVHYETLEDLDALCMVLSQSR